MLTRLVSLVLIPVLSVTALFGGTQEPKAARTPPDTIAAEMNKLAWIAGTWVIEKDGTTTEEHWRPLRGTTLLGTSHTFDAKATLFFEHLRIAAVHGTIAYIAMPGGAAPTAFPLVRNEDGVAVFENAAHDHPQRIRYERTEKGMTATVSMLDGSRAEVFAFTRQ